MNKVYKNYSIDIVYVNNYYFVTIKGDYCGRKRKEAKYQSKQLNEIQVECDAMELIDGFINAREMKR